MKRPKSFFTHLLANVIAQSDGTTEHTKSLTKQLNLNQSGSQSDIEVCQLCPSLPSTINDCMAERA